MGLQGNTYYYNNETGETSWDPPPGFEDGAAAADTAGGAEAAEEFVTEEGASDDYPEWSEVWDDGSQSYYYYNSPSTAFAAISAPHARAQRERRRLGDFLLRDIFFLGAHTHPPSRFAFSQTTTALRAGTSPRASTRRRKKPSQAAAAAPR